MEASNPYRPPRPTSSPSDAPSKTLVFDGMIVESDYVSMLPDNRLLIWTFQIAVWTTNLLGVLMGGTIAVVMVRDGDFEMLFPGIAMIAVLAVINTFAFWFLSPVKRARKHLKRFPDVIGQAHGQFDASGLELNDGNCVHWFGPQSLRDMTISHGGIRLPLDTNPYRYLAFSKRLFDAYDKELALDLKRHWNSRAEEALQSEWTKTPFAPDTGPHWKSPEENSSNFICFQGPVTMELSPKTAAQRKQAVTQTASAVIGALGAIAAWLIFGSLWGGVGLAYAATASWSSFKNWQFYYSDHYQHSWNQAGWVDSDSFAFRSDDTGFRLNKRAFKEVSIEPELITLAITPGSPVFLTKQQVADTADWEKLSAWAQKIKSDLES